MRFVALLNNQTSFIYIHVLADLNGNSDPRVADTDKDGFNDLSEGLDGTNPRRPDTERDGWLDGAERTAGSDPLKPSSTPRGLSV